MAQRVVTSEDKTLVRPDGGPGFVRVRIETNDQRTLTKEVKYAKADPNNPMTPAEMKRKVYECTDAAGIGRSQADDFIARVRNLEDVSDVSSLSAGLAT